MSSSIIDSSIIFSSQTHCSIAPGVSYKEFLVKLSNVQLEGCLSFKQQLGRGRWRDPIKFNPFGLAVLYPGLCRLSAASGTCGTYKEPSPTNRGHAAQELMMSVVCAS